MPIQHTNPPRALLRGDLPDSFTRALYKIAPYRGCAHGCRYCDGRAERYFVQGDFEKDIQVRDSIPAALMAELPALREEGMVVFGSGTTDPYQPCEAGESITGRAAAILASPPRGSPRLAACVLTKSALVERDLDSWSRANASGAGFMLLMSITSVDEALREAMEPGASSFADRFRALARFKAAGCTTGILAMPLLPGLSDSEDSIGKLYEAARGIGVDFIMPGGLTLRPGRQKELYLHTLEKWRPELLDSTLALYAEERTSGSPNRGYLTGLNQRISKIRKGFRLPFLLQHRMLARLLPSHDSFRILLRDMVELYRERGVDTRPLVQAAGRYDDWLIGLRRHFRRHRTLPRAWLPERFANGVDDGELDRILANPKLAAFARDVLFTGARLDYLTLELNPA